MSVTRLLDHDTCKEYALTLELYRGIVQRQLNFFTYTTPKEAATCKKAGEVYRELFHILKPHVSAELARDARDRDVAEVLDGMRRSK